MLTKQQIKLIQTAVRAAGLRTPRGDGRYRLMLCQYKQPNGQPVTSCKQLNHAQLEDLLAICEAYGWRMPGKEDTFYRMKRARAESVASFAQQSAIKHLAGDLGWYDYQLEGMLKRMTGGFVMNVAGLNPAQAYDVIEALKTMVGRQTGKQYNNLKEVQQDMEINNGACKIG
jgi:hypothetical protein